MTSIIGYTRVPFNTSASKNFSIAPVQRLYQNKSPFQDPQQQQQLCIVENDGGFDSTCKNNRRPSYHRIFSREMSQHGIIELITDKRKQKEDTDNTNNNNNNNRSIKDNNKVVTTPNKDIDIPRRPSLRSGNSVNYNILLSIDLSSAHDYDSLSSSIQSSQDSLQSLMNAISRIAQEKTVHFVQILNLLKKLQSQQDKHRFMSCIDKHSGKILVYFPNTISYTSVDQTYEWLKYTVDVDIDRFKHWQLSVVDEQKCNTDNTMVQPIPPSSPKPTPFDGENYFNDLHLFIDHIDTLIESDGLFSHHKNKKKRENQ